MRRAPLPLNEEERLIALRELALLDSPSEERFDRITRLVMRMFGVPIALVALIDTNRQWFKSCFGLETKETPREISFCAHTILESETLVIPDATRDERFHDNPLVVGPPHIQV